VAKRRAAIVSSSSRREGLTTCRESVGIERGTVDMVTESPLR
jgi:hypothetical protein